LKSIWMWGLAEENGVMEHLQGKRLRRRTNTPVPLESLAVAKD